jgi:hypothetical protein
MSALGMFSKAACDREKEERSTQLSQIAGWWLRRMNLHNSNHPGEKTIGADKRPLQSSTITLKYCVAVSEKN